MQAPSLHSFADDSAALLETPARRFDRIQIGRPEPLGAVWDGKGTNFAVFSPGPRAELCLFDENGAEQRVDLPGRFGGCWHGYLPGIGPGQRYGFRVHGRWDPEHGQRFNPAKLLLDPYARAIDGELSTNLAVLPYVAGSDGEAIDDTDSGPHVPRSVVIDAAFDWQGDRRHQVPLLDSVIYEVHVKGFSARHPAVPPELRGTYAGLAHPASIDHLQHLGVTAVELLPVHQFVHEATLRDRGLANYWGYNSIGFFAPHAAYASDRRTPDRVVHEFKTMVKTLHAAGIEVLLDVVYNHTAEGNHLGPMLCFKGLDNETYYRLAPDSRSHYVNFTGVGNTLDLRQPQTLRLVMDSLRYWVTEMHVDGFRFDLAVTLARGDKDFDTRSTFLATVAQDPVLRETKLIAEPWDVAEGGYQVGHFPAGWSEWNGRFRDTVRDFWRSQPGVIGDFATRITGSADLYQPGSRSPSASVNFVTAHDGFTLKDLVSYNDKHNEANLEENRDGTSDHRSWNLGVEGPTDDEAVQQRRAQQVRNVIATTLLSQGVPMLLAGDEIGHTQHGNNNAFCQDNEISWMDWERADAALILFTRRVIALRRGYGAFRRRTWPAGRPNRRRLAEVAWFARTGEEMSASDWTNPERRSVALYLDDEGDATAAGRPKAHDRFLLLWNAALEPVAFKLPSLRWGPLWRPVLDTADDSVGQPDQDGARHRAGSLVARPELSLLVLHGPRQPFDVSAR